ncbi:hypothetical protein GN244_ATG01299 [Phytophthora infestans]|uniref:Uncharacterized protein n=1 Tax=Phytophthora infestans TaxID=4787 RepID=A0A833WN83_PHYIN|nr:hypothetical protein GN244_ATG01299 [Phytophthora infestans]
MSLSTTYNVRNNKAALVGNWVEEEALRDKTDHDHRKESRIEPTYERVLQHDTSAKIAFNSHASKITPPPFETTPQGSHRYADYAADKPGEQRAREREEQQLDCHGVALRTIATSNLPVNWSRSGFRVEAMAQTDSIDQMKLDLVQSTTVTRYSYAVNPWLELCRDCLGGRNAFGRPSTFTNGLNDPTKRHGEATEPGAIHDERIGASVHQRSALRRLLTLLKGAPDTTRRLLDMLRHGSDARANQLQREKEREYIILHDFSTALVAAGATLPAKSDPA